MTLDASKTVKKISLKFIPNNLCVFGMKFLDKNDYVISEWDNYSGATWTEAHVIPDGFEIIGIFGDTRKDYSI